MYRPDATPLPPEYVDSSKGSSSRRKPGSRFYRAFWMPAFVGMTAVDPPRLKAGCRSTIRQSPSFEPEHPAQYAHAIAPLRATRATHRKPPHGRLSQRWSRLFPLLTGQKRAMAMAAFDTLKFVERLTAAGISAAHAKPKGEALQEVLEVNLKDLATRQDLRELKLEFDHKFERELAPVRADLLLVKWMLGLVLGGILALIIKTFFA